MTNPITIVVVVFVVTAIAYGAFRFYRLATQTVVTGTVEKTLVRCPKCASLGLHIGLGVYEFYAAPTRCKSECQYKTPLSTARAFAGAGGEREALAKIKKMFDQLPGLVDANRNARIIYDEVKQRLPDPDAWRKRMLEKKG